MPLVISREASRRFAMLAHRWVGLALALFMLVAGLSGAAIAFLEEGDHWLNRRHIDLHGPVTALPLAELVQMVEARYPQASVRGVFVGETSSQAWLFTLRPRGQAALAADQVWVDPSSGTVRADRLGSSFALDARHLMPSLLLMHRSLLLGPAGQTLMGVVALLWLLSSLVGLYLALPRVGPWRRAWSLKLNASVLKRYLDLHRVTGLVSALVLLPVAFSGTYLGLPDGFRAAIQPFSSLAESPLKKPIGPSEGAGITAETALAIAASQFPGGQVRGLYLHADKRVYQVRVRLADDINSGNGTGRVFVDMRDGHVLAKRSYRDAGGAGDTLIAWMFPLHSGQAFGNAGRFVVALMGLVAAFMAYSGMCSWWLRRQALAHRAAPIAASRSPS